MGEKKYYNWLFGWRQTGHALVPPCNVIYMNQTKIGLKLTIMLRKKWTYFVTGCQNYPKNQSPWVVEKTTYFCNMIYKYLLTWSLEDSSTSKNTHLKKNKQ